jgi:NitT/TauT family transport system permease protein
VPTSYIEAARSLQVRRLPMFVEVIVPASLSRIFTSLRLGVGYAILVVIGTEMVSSNDGIGYLMWSGWNLFRTEQMFVGIVMSALLGGVATTLVSAIERLAMPWRRTGGRIVA